MRKVWRSSAKGYYQRWL